MINLSAYPCNNNDKMHVQINPNPIVPLCNDEINDDNEDDATMECSDCISRLECKLDVSENGEISSLSFESFD